GLTESLAHASGWYGPVAFRARRAASGSCKPQFKSKSRLFLPALIAAVRPERNGSAYCAGMATNTGDFSLSSLGGAFTEAVSIAIWYESAGKSFNSYAPSGPIL